VTLAQTACSFALADVSLVDASCMSFFTVACSRFVHVLLSLLLLAAEGMSLFYFSVVSFPLAPLQAPLLNVIQLLSDVAVLTNITDTLSEPILQL